MCSASFAGYLQCALSLTILAINRSYFVKGYKGIIHRAPGMDALVSIGAGVSFLYSVYLLIIKSDDPLFFESAGMIFTLITLGKSLESKSKAHTMDAINALSGLVPDTATVIVGEEERTVKESALKKGDIVLIRAGERIPVDGTVVFGEAVTDKSALTGESLPVSVRQDDYVISGTVVSDGNIKVAAEKTGKETTLNAIIETVKNAAMEKTPVERLADKVSGVFVPIVLGISLITLFVWIILGKDFSFALKMAINVIVISCPCALGLATPTAVMAGTGNAASHGVLIRSPECLEAAGNVTMVVFDKTGTVTSGKMSVTAIVSIDGGKESDMLVKAAALEAAFSHPYAKAIRERALSETDGKYEAAEQRMISGRGITGIIGEERLFLGNEMLMKENGIDISSVKAQAMSKEEEGCTVLFFAGDNLYGYFAIEDELREDSRKSISALSDNGAKVMLLTGDSEVTAKAIALRLGIADYVSGVLPNGKEKMIGELMRRGERVAMVGDGINDAAALVTADVGIAVGNGTQIAIDSADFILMKDSIKDVPYMLALSKRVVRIVKENLFWAFFYNIIGIPIAAGVFSKAGLTFNPMIAAACMSVSSLFVVSNALRLKGDKK